MHLSGELFKRMAGIEMTHVPYRGGGPAVNDLIPGRVDVMFNTIGTALPLVRGGQLRGLAVTTAGPVLGRRPIVPTVAEVRGAGLRRVVVVRVLRAGPARRARSSGGSRPTPPRPWPPPPIKEQHGEASAVAAASSSPAAACRPSQGRDGQVGVR